MTQILFIIIFSVLLSFVLLAPFLFIKLRRQFAASRQKADVERLVRKIRPIYADVRQGRINKTTSEKFLALMDKALCIINSRSDEEWRSLAFGEMLSLRNEIEQMSLFVSGHSSSTPLSEEIERLATLRDKDMISDFEFQEFSERFKLSTGEKASSIVKAISELYEQHQQGAMSRGNYHAALWSLLDKLDRKT